MGEESIGIVDDGWTGRVQRDLQICWLLKVGFLNSMGFIWVF